MRQIDIEQVLIGYVNAGIFFSSENDNGKTLDRDFDGSEIDEESRQKMRDICAKFVTENLVLLEQLPESFTDEFIGHNLWLETTGSRRGFWDRDLGELGEKLEKACVDPTFRQPYLMPTETGDGLYFSYC